MGRWLDEYRGLEPAGGQGSDEPCEAVPGIGNCPPLSPSADPARPALAPGWTVAYRDSGGTLRDGVVAEHVGSQVHLVSGAVVPVRAIVSVSDGAGAWLVRDHGLISGDRQPRPDWTSAWRAVAALTDGITRDDPRFHPIMAALDQCDTAYLAGDWPVFQHAAEQVKHAVRGGQYNRTA